MRILESARQSRLLNQYWDKRESPTQAQEGLDEQIGKTIETLHAIDNARLPDPAFVANLETLVASAASHNPETMPGQLEVAPSTPPIHLEPPRDNNLPRLSSRWKAASLAAAVLTFVAAAGAWLQFFDDDSPETLTVPAASTSSSDVPFFGGDAGRTLVMPSAGPSVAPEIAWSFDAGEGLTSTPVLADGVLYFGTGYEFFFGGGYDIPGKMLAIDATTGELLWEFATEDSIQAPAAISGDMLFFGDWKGTFFAIDRHTGSEIWRINGLSGFSSAPVVENDIVVFSTGEWFPPNPILIDGSVVAAGGELYELGSHIDRTVVHGVRADNGAPLWTFNDFPTTGGKVVSLNPGTGALQWSYDSAPLVAFPSAADGSVYVSTSEPNNLIAIDSTSGEQRWTASLGDELMVLNSTPTVSENEVFVIAREGLISAFAIADGAPLWQVRPHHFLLDSSLVLAGSSLYTVTNIGRMTALDPGTGATQWQYELPETQQVHTTPVVADGTIFIGNFSTSSVKRGTLFALRAPTD